MNVLNLEMFMIIRFYKIHSKIAITLKIHSCLFANQLPYIPYNTFALYGITKLCSNIFRLEVIIKNLSLSFSLFLSLSISNKYIASKGEI